MNTGEIPFDLLIVRTLYTIVDKLDKHDWHDGYLDGAKKELAGFINNYDYEGLSKKNG